MDRLAPEISGSSAEDISDRGLKGGRARGVQTEPEHARRPRSWEQHDRLHRMLRLGPEIAKAFLNWRKGDTIPLQLTDATAQIVAGSATSAGPTWGDLLGVRPECDERGFGDTGE